MLMSNFSYRMHPVCKCILAAFIIALSYTTWDNSQLMMLCSVVLLLIAMDFDVATILGMGVALLIAGFMIALALLFRNSIDASVGIALHVLIMLLASLYMLRTPVAELLRGLQSCHVPDQLMLGFLVVFRFVDVLRMELNFIYQASTMIPTNRISVFKKLYRCLIFPFVYRMFVLSDQLTISIETRDFGVAKRSNYKVLPVKLVDIMIMIGTMILAVVILWMQ